LFLQKRTEQKSLEAGKQLFYLRKGNKKDNSTGAAKLESERKAGGSNLDHRATLKETVKNRELRKPENGLKTKRNGIEDYIGAQLQKLIKSAGERKKTGWKHEKRETDKRPPG